jgi:fermentation-respiration switch protein FrsA (DUF1100 family)
MHERGQKPGVVTSKYSGPERRKSRRWQPRRGRFLIFCLVLVALCYGSAVLWLMEEETLIVFQAGAALAPTRPEFPYQQIDLPRADGARQFAWVMTPETAAGAQDTPWLLYLHGNAATIASQVNIGHYRGLRSLGLNILAPEYRGFGGLDGLPTEASLAADARAAYEYLRGSRQIVPRRLVIYGWSLGGAVAVQLASEVEETALILEGAPASMASISQRRYPLFPIRLIMRNPFEAIARIDRVGAPILFLHSSNDEAVPIAEGRRLFDAARGPKRFVELTGGHVHTSDTDAAPLFGAIRTFLTEQGVLPANTNPTGATVPGSRDPGLRR